MVRDDQAWLATTAQFYGQLYACVWQNLEPFLGASTALELLTLSSQPLHEAYPFLARLAWSTEGLDANSLTAAMATEERAHVQAGCEQLLQSAQTLVQEIGGALFAQRLRAATEQLRLAFEPAFSRPAAPEEVECSATPADPDKAVLLYRRLQAQDVAMAQAVLQARHQATEIRPEMTSPPLAPAGLTRSEAF